MAASKIIALTAVAALGLTACDDRDERRGGAAGLCTPFAEASTANSSANSPGPMAALPADASTAVDECLHRWGYSLAKSEDDADIVAQATVAACASALSRWNQQTLGQPSPTGSGSSGEAPSLLTGEQTTPIAEHFTYAQGRALFYVVQARAGNCPAPRMENGAQAASNR